MTDTLSSPTVPQEPQAGPSSMRPVELGRWLWRQLTSMRTALVLLLLLTLGAVPGSLVPQEGIDPLRVAQFKAEHPSLSGWYEPLGLFHVYSAPWFAAIYLLLFVSLVGCVLPRSRAHWAVLRSRPPATPRYLHRLPVHVGWSTDAPAEDVLVAAGRVLRRRRFRVVADGSVRAEKGYLRETGNLVFHLSLVLLLVAVAAGRLFGFDASRLVVEREGFANTVPAYDTFRRGPLFAESRLVPFSVRLRDFSVRYQARGDQQGAPREFSADLTYRSAPDADPRPYDLRVNHPLVVGGTKVFLIGNGYAPVFTVRDGNGDIAFSGPVPFLPRDGNNTSTGVVKAPAALPEQLGFEGLFLPTAAVDDVLGPISTYPDLVLPRAVLNAWTGDLGLASGQPQSVYRLDTDGMTQVRVAGGEPLRRALAPGEVLRLPGGGGSIRFDGVRRYATLKVASDPGRGLALTGAALALAGLMLSLFVPRRRIWVRAEPGEDGRTLVEVGGLSRTDGDLGGGLGEEVVRVASALPGGPAAGEEEERG